MKKTIILLGLLVILSSFVYASSGYFDNLQFYWTFNRQNITGSTMYDLKGNYNADIIEPVTKNLTGINGDSFYFGYGIGELRPNPHYALLNSNFSITMWLKPTLNDVYIAGGTDGGYMAIEIGDRSGTGTNNKFCLYMYDTAVSNYCSVCTTTSANYDNLTWQFVVFVHDETNNKNLVYLNGVNEKNTSCGEGVHVEEVVFGGNSGDDPAYTYQGFMDELGIYNVALTATNITYLSNSGVGFFPPDYTAGTTNTTPPTISNLNCTSCDEPNGDIISPYETEDTTPTFKFNTSENAWCAISKYDWNYTTMGASRNCTSGEGTQNHICTLTTQDRFTNVGTNYTYISCKDSSGNEGNVSNHSKSNSGQIRMEIKGASETPGDNAIEIGIDTSKIKDIAIKYPEQRLSARNLANSQFTGIFDWVVANQNNSRKWAFNYVSEGESEITPLFNLSTVLYVLQLKNQTNETITDQVGKLINSTWP